jgi:hypothetical protein
MSSEPAIARIIAIPLPLVFDSTGPVATGLGR